MVVKKFIKFLLLYFIMFIFWTIIIFFIYYFGIKFFKNVEIKYIFLNKWMWIISFIINNIFLLAFYLLFNFRKQYLKNINDNNIVNGKLEKENTLTNFSKITSLGKNSGFSINYKIINNKLSFNLLNQHHMLIIGTTGIGKSQSIVIPNIISNIYSKEHTNLIIFDPKAELYEKTIKYIDKNIYNIIQLDFINFNKSKWNPFRQLSKLWQENNLIEFELLLDNISEMFVNNIKSNKDPIWHNASLILLKAHIICVLICSDKKFILTPKILIETFSIELSNLIKKYKKILKNINESKEKILIFQKHVTLFLDKDNKMLPSIYLMTLTSLQKISSMNFFNMSETNDVDLVSNKNNKRNIVFIISDPFNDVYWQLSSLFIFQTINDLIKSNNKHKTLFILDEFGNLPTIKNFSNIISISRGYNIFFMLIIQSFEQLNNRYDDYKNILANINYQLFLHTNDIQTAKDFSQKLGKVEILKINNIDYFKKYNLTSTIKPVMDEYDLTTLEKNYAILKSAHYHAIILKLLPFYCFGNFK